MKAKPSISPMFDREIILLRAFYDALKYSHGVAELLAVRASIERLITVDAEIIHVPPLPQLFPPLTAEYLAEPKQHPLDFEGIPMMPEQLYLKVPNIEELTEGLANNGAAHDRREIEAVAVWCT